MKVYFDENGQRVAFGTLELDDFVGFEVAKNDVLRTIAIIEDGKVVGVEIDESIVFDEESEGIVEYGNTLRERVDDLEFESTTLGQMVTQQEIESMLQGQQITDMELRLLMKGAN